MIAYESPAKQKIAELVLRVISDSSGNQIEDIRLESNLTTELNFTKEDCLRLVKIIEKTYNAQLSSDQDAINLDSILTEFEADEIENVSDLIDAVFNEAELG